MARAMPWRLPPLLTLAVIFGGLIGCSDDGCGGGSKAGPERVAKEDSGGMAPPSKGGGGGSADIRVSRFDSSKQPKKDDTPKKQAEAASNEASLTVAPRPIPRVGAKDFKAKVLGVPGALLLVFKAGCPECDAAAPVLQGLASDFKGQCDFYQLNAGDPASRRLLPKGARTPPAFVLYENGKPLSFRQGFPMRAKAGEKAEDFQARLAQWFRDALISKDLSIKAAP